MKIGRMLFAAALVLAAGCDSATSSSRAAEKAAPAGGPSLDFGSTASVAVHCPATLQNVQSAECVAYGYDANGRYTTSSGATWSTPDTR